MNTEKINGMIVFSVILTVIGLIFIFFSDNLGDSIAGHWLQKYDFADTWDYRFKKIVNTLIFLVVGIIMSCFGALNVFGLIYYKWFKKT